MQICYVLIWYSCKTLIMSYVSWVKWQMQICYIYMNVWLQDSCEVKYADLSIMSVWWLDNCRAWLVRYVGWVKWNACLLVICLYDHDQTIAKHWAMLVEWSANLLYLGWLDNCKARIVNYISLQKWTVMSIWWSDNCKAGTVSYVGWKN